MDIKEALSQLDALDDDVWTGDGAPKLDAVAELVGKKVTRKQVIEAAPQFTRDNFDMEPAPEPEPEPKELKAEEDEVTSQVEDFFAEDYHSHAEVVTAVRKLPVQGLASMVELLNQQMVDIENKKRELDSLRGLMKYAKANVTSRMKSETPDMDNQAAIREFLKAQHANRLEKARATQELLKTVDLSKIDSRAMIDRAMSRKVGRGGSRPIHPVRG